MFNSDTRKVIDTLSKKMCNAAIFSYPITAIKKTNNSVVSFFNLEKLGEDHFNEFGLEEISTVIGVANLFDEPVISIDDNGAMLVADTKSNQSVKYLTQNVAVLEQTYRAKPSMINNVLNAETCTSFVLTKEIWDKKILKAASLLSLDEIVININTSSNEIKLTATTKETQNAFDIMLQGETHIDCNIVLGMDVLSSLPTVDYNVKIQKGPNGKLITVFTPVENPYDLYIFAYVKRGQAT